MERKNAERNFWRTSTLVTTAITILSIAPIPDVPQIEDVPFFDKWVHFVMYGSMALSIWFDWWRSQRWEMPPTRIILTALFLPVFWGGLLELCQACLPYRSGDWMDFLANSFGALLGSITAYITWKISEKISEAR